MRAAQPRYARLFSQRPFLGRWSASAVRTRLRPHRPIRVARPFSGRSAPLITPTCLLFRPFTPDVSCLRCELRATVGMEKRRPSRERCAQGTGAGPSIRSVGGSADYSRNMTVTHSKVGDWSSLSDLPSDVQPADDDVEGHQSEKGDAAVAASPVHPIRDSDESLDGALVGVRLTEGPSREHVVLLGVGDCHVEAAVGAEPDGWMDGPVPVPCAGSERRGRSGSASARWVLVAPTTSRRGGERPWF